MNMQPLIRFLADISLKLLVQHAFYYIYVYLLHKLRLINTFYSIDTLITTEHLLDRIIVGTTLIVYVIVGRYLEIKIQKYVDRFTFAGAEKMQTLEKCNRLIEDLNYRKEMVMEIQNTVLDQCEQGIINEGVCLKISNELKSQFLAIESKLIEAYAIHREILS